MILFKGRRDAGKKLAEEISLKLFFNPIVLGIPRGGIVVGEPIAYKLSCPLEPITLRKLPLPMNDQMGFGVVTLDKKVILNEELIRAGYIDRESIQPIVDEVYKEVQRRDRHYRGDRPFPKLENRSVIIVDDGLATGYTMLGAIKFAQDKGSAGITVAVPVAHIDAYNLVEKEAKVFTLYKSESFAFAIASFYEDFPDITDLEVIEILEKTRAVLSNK